MTIVMDQKSTVERAATALRREILSGKLAPGESLREEWVAEQLGIARNTVRETLQLLAHEGLVTHVPRRGASVTLVTRADVADIFGIRRRLEIEGARQAVGGDVADLEDAVERLEGAAARGDWVGYADHETDFHEALVRRLGSPRLSEVFSRALRELRVALSSIDVAQAGDRPVPGYVREHREILRRISAGESGKAGELVATHLDRSERMVLRHLEETA